MEQPYGYKKLFQEIKLASNNFKDETIYIWVSFEQERDIIVNKILNKHYKSIGSYTTDSDYGGISYRICASNVDNVEDYPIIQKGLN